MTSRVLDWVSRHDPKSKQYGVTSLYSLSGRRAAIARTRVMWQPPAYVLNQGEEGACVPHGWVHEAAASPVRVDFAQVALPAGYSRDPQALAFELYDWCRRNDEWPGEDYAGTSVLTGAQAMQLIGVLKSYRWCFRVSEVIDALLTVGPVVLGIPWLSGMYEPVGGHLQVTGSVVGGHCILAIGYDPAYRFPDGTTGPAVALFNSWGPDWGVNGVAWIRVADLSRLLAKQGEACVPLQRSYARAKLAALTLRVVRAVEYHLAA